MSSRVLRLTGSVVTGMAVVALAAGPASGDVWRGGAAGDAGFRADSGAAGSDQPGGGQDDRPWPAACEWDRPPRPDSALDLPDPDDYLVETEDGELLVPDEVVEFNGHRLSLPVLVDLMAVAEQEGIGVEEAIFRYGWQDKFSQVVTELADRYPDQYAGGAITGDGCGAWIGFTDAVPPEAANLAESLPVPVELVAGRGFGEPELADLMPEVYYPIYEHPDVADAMGSPDHETGVITVHAQPRGPTTPTDRHRLCAALRPPAPANPAVTVRLILVEDLDSWPDTRTHPC